VVFAGERRPWLEVPDPLIAGKAWGRSRCLRLPMIDSGCGVAAHLLSHFLIVAVLLIPFSSHEGEARLIYWLAVGRG
jgi:hypothetical protein